MTDSELTHALIRFVMTLERSLTPKETNRDYSGGKYPFIPFNMPEFMKMVAKARDLHAWLYGRRRPLFLDVGSGIGTKVIMAEMLDIPSHGLELNPKYLKMSRGLLKIHPNRIIEGDARNFGGYGGYDIIYFYCPMRDKKLQVELEKAIYERSKDGTILIEVLKMNDPMEDEPLLHRLSGPIFIKTSNEELLAKAKAFFEKEKST